MPKLLVSLHDGPETTHELSEQQITVGRLSDNAIQIEDASVSSHHAELRLGEGGDYVLTDLGSTNGTWVNTTEALEGAEHRLQDGDKVRFGNIDTSYVSENPADARPMPDSMEAAVVPASSSVRPANFENASPFQTKKKKKDTAGVAIVAFAVVAILAFGGAVAAIVSLAAPAL